MIASHMMDWMPLMWGWGIFPLMGIFGYWLVFLVIAYLVYKDAESRGMNGLLWALLVLLPWLGIPFLLIYLITRKERTSRGALEILEERYAKGELTRDEYLRMKEDLKRGYE